LSQGLRVDNPEKFLSTLECTNMRTALVMGATGFIGGQIAQAALEAGWKVSGYRRNPEHTGQLEGFPVN
jgi:NADP-dependent 3-hydroxy acid dehydrogenase YdfG